MSTGNGTALVEAPRPTMPAKVNRIEVQDDGPLAFMMDTARFEHMYRIATSMAASVFLPEHLRGKKVNGNLELYPPNTIAANCFRVLNQAMRWGVDPFSVCDETFVTGGKIGYSGKLIAAIVNSRAGLEGRLQYEFSGSGKDRAIKVIGKFRGMAKPVDVTLTVKEGIEASDKGKGPNPMWIRDPDQKLVYSGVVKWARRHCPEIIMGVLTEDDLERIESERAQAERAGTSELNDKLKSAFTQPVAKTAALPEPVDTQTAEEQPEQTEQTEQPEQPEFTDIQVGTWEAFSETLVAIGGENGVYPQIANECILKLRTSGLKVAASRPSDAMKARRQVLTAARNGQLDWSQGKIIE